uniref:Protein MODIFIER OF SNC1 1 n=1 Tax=Anthurium amnicola TaxID=1678845 RepID=A0A1D1ZE71_9ARAE
MASSMVTGDRRWGQTRKSGMTVLGKVPKPINLPSQRLENHGLDPNVEIVPKGTLTWGNRPSLTTPNAWGSSSVSSTNTDGSTVSPSGLSGRPSSAGSFTRPSTAASDRSHQAVSGAWGPNSRPSSASGILPSNQTTAAVTRPRSAETRPGSSQRSRYAEPVAESSAWGATRTAEKLVSASRSNNFTLSSGDFPTLGSEKNSKSNVVQQGHSSLGRPASASGRAAAEKETMEPTPTGSQTVVDCLDKEHVNTWTKDNSPYTGSSSPPSSGDWHRDQQQTHPYPLANVPSHQFDSWHGPPMQTSPDGIWYRGGPPGGLYRPGGPSGSYPVESYIYYPQLPARPLSNSQAGPRHGTVVSGYGPTNGVPYHTHTPDSYMVPSHPISSMRPEIYPQVHYGPTTSFGNGNEQDGPVLGMAPRPSYSHRHLSQKSNVDSENFHAGPCYYGPSKATEQVEDGHAHESHEPQYKVLLKQHNACKENDSEENNDHSVGDGVAPLDIRDHSGAPRSAEKKGGMEPAKVGLDAIILHPAKGSEIHSSVPTGLKNVVISTKSETVDDHCANTAGQGEDPHRYSVKKSSALMEKIESLNNKARLADGRCVIPAFIEEEKKRQFKNLNVKADATEVANTSNILPEKSSAETVASDGDMAKVNSSDTSTESTVNVKPKVRASETQSSAVGLLGPSDVGLAAHSQIHRRVHSKQNQAAFHTKSRFNSQDGEEWRKKSPGRDSTVPDGTVSHPESRVQDCHPCEDSSEMKEFHHMKVGDEPYSVSSMDPVDYKAQHAKMREIARQRAKQLQKEEDERIREQKARALAKLEELNKRTLAECSNQTLHYAPGIETHSGQDARMCPDSKTNTIDSGPPKFNSDSTNAVVQKDDKVNTLGVPTVMQTKAGVTRLEESVDSSPKAVSLSFVHNEPSVSLMQDVIKTQGKTDSGTHDSRLSKQKQMPHKRQDTYSEEKHVREKNVSIGVLVGSIIVGSKNLGESVPPTSSNDDGVSSNNKAMDEHSMQHRKRNGRATRNKNKSDEVSLIAISQSARTVPENVTTECCEPKFLESVVEDIPVVSETSNGAIGDPIPSDVATVSPKQGSFQGITEGVPRKVTVQWKPQPTRRVTRNPQATKSVDKFHGTEAVVWAPVGSTNKKEEVQKVTNEVNPDSSGKNVNNVELNLKYKRAEMERYVPKPIAKETSQQVKPQQLPSPSHHQTESGLKVELGSQGTTDSGGLEHSVTLKVGVLADTKNWENIKPNKPGRTHASWRRRCPPESLSPSLGFLEGSSSDSHKNTQKTCEQPLKHDSREQPKFSDDGWNDDNNCLMQCESSIAPLVEKHQAKMSRGRRQPLKGHKVAGNNNSSSDNWEPGHGRTDKGQMMTIEADEFAGRNGKRSENQCASDHPRSQWQPKSQACCEGTREQRVASQDNIFDKKSSFPGAVSQPFESKSILTASTVSSEVRNVRQHEDKRERKVGEESSIRRSPTANQDSAAASHLAPQNAEPQNEPVTSGTRRYGQHGGWLARGHETSVGGSYGLEQDTGKHNLPANVDRRKQFQRAGYYCEQNDSFQHNSAVGEEAQDGSKAAGKYRERGHNNSRRGGHFYSRNRTSDASGNGE